MLLFPTNFSKTEDCSYSFVAKGDYSGDGTKVPDNSRRGTLATLNGGASVVAGQGLVLPGITGSSLSLDGQYLSLASDGAMSCWLKLEKPVAENENYIYPIFSQYYSLDPDNYHIILAITKDLSLLHIIKRGKDYERNYCYSVSTLSADIDYDKWIHVVFNKRDRFDTTPYHMYVNGVIRERGSMRRDSTDFNSWVWLASMSLGINDTVNTSYQIGTFPVENLLGRRNFPFKGIIDNIMFFNDRLDESRVQQIYNQQRRT